MQQRPQKIPCPAPVLQGGPKHKFSWIFPQNEKTDQRLAISKTSHSLNSFNGLRSQSIQKQLIPQTQIRKFKERQENGWIRKDCYVEWFTKWILYFCVPSQSIFFPNCIFRILILNMSCFWCCSTLHVRSRLDKTTWPIELKLFLNLLEIV